MDDISRSAVLAAIRRCSDYLKLASNDDERMLLRSGVMPRDLLLSIFKASDWSSPRGRMITAWLDELVVSKRVIASRSYYKAEPRDRLRPIHTLFNIEKPQNVPPRSQAKITLHRTDKLALWYAAANKALTGAQKESTGLYLILQFWRLPRIQKAWRRWIASEHETIYSGPLPEDAIPSKKSKSRKVGDV